VKTTKASFIKHQESASKRGLELKSTFHTNVSDKEAQESNFVPLFFDKKFELKHTRDIVLRVASVMGVTYCRKGTEINL
jgi:hypothetical protein